MVNKLKEAILCAADRNISTPRDFVWLSQKIYERTNERICPTTLKRFFGYLNDGTKPRIFTLDVLAQFIGYRDYSAFQDCSKSGEAPSSHLLINSSLDTDKLPKGQRLKLSWLPDRECIIRHLGGARFVVESVTNAKICEGDTFSCHLFINHEPLYLDNLYHEGNGPLTYIAGKKQGIVVKLC